MPSSTGLTASRWLGFAATETLIVGPEPAVNALGAGWYFTSPEPWDRRGSMLPSNSRKIWPYFLPTMLASTLSRPAVRHHADGDLVEPGLGGRRRDLVEHGIGRLPPSRRTASAHELGLEEGLERLGLR